MQTTDSKITPKTLILGATGLVGSEFSDDYIKVGSKDCDLRDKVATEKLFEEEKFENVICCAGTVGGIMANMTRKGEFFYDNSMIGLNVIESCRKFSIKKLVMFSSTCVFPNNVIFPLSEEKIHLGPPHPSNDAYAFSKRMLSVQVQAYREQYSLDYKVVIPCNIFGCRDNFSLEQSHCIPGIIHRVYLARENNTPLTIWGDGSGLREFAYSKDIAKLTELVLNEYPESEPIILTPAIEYSIYEVVMKIVGIMEFKGDIFWDHSKPSGQARKPASGAKIKKYWPNFKWTQIEQGLRETISYFESHYETIRR